MKKLCLIALLIPLLMLTGCVFDVPEGFSSRHHSYEEALHYARSIDPDATVDPVCVDAVDEYGHKYREWPAVMNGIACHVCSAHKTVYDCTGEFASTYYGLCTDYDHHLMQQLLEDGYDGWTLREDILIRYHSGGYLFVYCPAPADAPLSAEALAALREQLLPLHAAYLQRALGRTARYSLPAPVVLVNNSLEQKVSMGTSGITDLSDAGWADFLTAYHEKWQHTPTEGYALPGENTP